jgi:hypothetical protein
MRHFRYVPTYFIRMRQEMGTRGAFRAHVDGVMR